MNKRLKHKCWTKCRRRTLFQLPYSFCILLLNSCSRFSCVWQFMHRQKWQVQGKPSINDCMPFLLCVLFGNYRFASSPSSGFSTLKFEWMREIPRIHQNQMNQPLAFRCPLSWCAETCELLRVQIEFCITRYQADKGNQHSDTPKHRHGLSRKLVPIHGIKLKRAFISINKTFSFLFFIHTYDDFTSGVSSICRHCRHSLHFSFKINKNTLHIMP